MPFPPPPLRRRFAALAVLLLGLLAAGAVLLPTAGAQDEGSLRGRIDRGRTQERSLASAAARLARLERVVSREVTVLQGRLADTQTQLDAAQRRLDATRVRLDTARARALRLRTRLSQARERLDTMLRRRYMTQRPDVVTVVLDAQGFADLLERFEFLRRVEDANTSIVDVVRRARFDAKRERQVLTTFERRQAAAADEVARRRDALVSMASAMQQRRAALAQAHAARLAALRQTRAGRVRAQRTLDKLLADRAAAARASGPGRAGERYSIPWPVVQCESGGQNLPPNSAGASGYYQMMPATWQGLGGSTPNAFQAPKAEQDRLAAKLWNGGSGAQNWVCAALVG